MKKVAPKKKWGQHFLTDTSICEKIVQQYTNFSKTNNILEVGPGMGAVTRYFLEKKENNLHVVEIDKESIEFLEEKYPKLKNKIHSVDFLKLNLANLFDGKAYAVVGNFPYNVSSQILFHCLKHRNCVLEIMGMFQKEVAERIAEPPGSKQYGIISVLMQTYYTIDYCFTVHQHVFNPPPKVQSGVIHCVRNKRNQLPVNEELYFKVVKTTFNKRRKTIRNGLKAIVDVNQLPNHPLLGLRPEKLSVDEFIELTKIVQKTLATDGQQQL